jgi:hypothetical protein
MQQVRENVEFRNAFQYAEQSTILRTINECVCGSGFRELAD